MVVPDSSNNILYNNNVISNDNILLSILDNKATTDTVDLVCSEVVERYALCGGCDSAYVFEMTCNKRSCLACQVKRAKKLFMKYLPVIQNWDLSTGLKIQFLTITNLNVFEISKDYFDSRDKLLKKLILRLKKLGYVFDYGFINKEITHSDSKGYHYHYHILFYGPEINLQELNISDIWRDISQDSYFVKLYSKFNNAEHSLRYMLKYVCKPFESSKAIKDYFEITKGKRYFQTFGAKYKRQESAKLPFVCSSCFSNFKSNRYEYHSKLFYKHQVNLEVRQVKKLDYRRIRIHVEISSIKENKGLQIEINFVKPKFLEVFERYKGVDYNYDLIVLALGESEINRLLSIGEIFESKSGHLEVLR